MKHGTENRSNDTENCRKYLVRNVYERFGGVDGI
jgi:hypothetical protein